MSIERIVIAVSWLPLSALVTAFLVGAAIELTRAIEGWRDGRKQRRGS